MIKFLRNLLILILLVSSFSCKKKKSIHKKKENSKVELKTELINNVKIDSVSVFEIKRFAEKEYASIFGYYNEEKTGEESTWSEKLFGRCYSNSDLSFTENLFFKTMILFDDDNPSIPNISDTQYLTPYTFKPKPKSNLQIRLSLDLKKSFLEGKYSNENLLKKDEIIMNPIKLSLINGNVNSKTFFYKNGRIKEMEFYINKELKQIVTLLDTPLVQEITINGTFKTEDVITLIPMTYYLGTSADSISISEIQTNLGKTALSELNTKFNLMELMNKRD